MSNCYLIHHQERDKTLISDNIIVHHDKLGDNGEDPYLWNDKFLHTYCHMSQLTNHVGQINFWVARDSNKMFTQLLCDCVFVIGEKLDWKNSNSIDRADPIVDNDQVFEHHFKCINIGKYHQYKKRKRYTLKADAAKSFQPQEKGGSLIDILPFLNKQGIETNELKGFMFPKYGASRPFKLDYDLGQKLYNHLFSVASIKLFGKDLNDKRPNSLKTTPSCC